MKVAVIGGGSSYTRNHHRIFETHRHVSRNRIVVDGHFAERLDIVGNFARRIVDANGSPFKLHPDNQSTGSGQGRKLRYNTVARGLDAGTPRR